MGKRILILFISTALLVFDEIRRLALALCRRKPKARCVILYYHDIPKEYQKQFARQMDILLKLCRPIRCTEIPYFEEGHNYVGITFDDGFISFKEVALRELECRRLPATIFIPTEFLGNAPGWLSSSSERLMTPAEIGEIAKNNLITIGSHGVSHRPFTRMLLNEVKLELMESRSVLESLTGNKVTSFSFPHGAYSTECLKMAKEAGYSLIFSIQPHCAFESDDEHITGRVKVHPLDWRLEFVLKVVGAYRWLPYAIRLKKSLRTLFL
jgi:peptidoglycan/xylan/chitin deacetylase (PgdA/CDA1 family)